MKFLFENWQQYIGEQDEVGVDPQKNLKIALEIIKSEGYEHEVNKNTIKVKQPKDLLDNKESFIFLRRLQASRNIFTLTGF